MQRQVVLLGASNLTRCFPHVVTLAREGFDEPLSFYVAKGLGRSFGREAGCLGKNFPGIFFSRIWNALRSANSAPISAVITDIGNDLGYEVPVDTLLQWVAGCIDHLQDLGADVVVTDIPVDTIRGVGEARLRFFRTVLFPACRLSREELTQRVQQLREGLHEVALARKTTVIPVQNHWYGADPIHPRLRYLKQLWVEVLQRLDGFNRDITTSHNSLLTDAYLRLLQAKSWSRFGFKRHKKQPHGQLHDGTEIFLY